MRGHRQKPQYANPVSGFGFPPQGDEIDLPSLGPPSAYAYVQTTQTHTHIFTPSGGRTGVASMAPISPTTDRRQYNQSRIMELQDDVSISQEAVPSEGRLTDCRTRRSNINSSPTNSSSITVTITRKPIIVSLWPLGLAVDSASRASARGSLVIPLPRPGSELWQLSHPLLRIIPRKFRVPVNASPTALRGTRMTVLKMRGHTGSLICQAIVRSTW